MIHRPIFAFGLVLLLMGCDATDFADSKLETDSTGANDKTARQPTGSFSLIEQSSPIGDWPRFLGPRADSISKETAWLKSWSKDNKPHVTWRANVGIGFSSVSVSEGRLYTMGHGKDLDTVYCFEAATGKKIWRHDYAAHAVPRNYEGGPSSTPTVEAGRVYSVGKEGQLFCLDAVSGDVIWRRHLRDELGVKMPPWGFACSPLIVGNRVIVDGGRTAAFDKRTGKLLWKTRIFSPGYGSPVGFNIGEVSHVVVLNNEGLLIVRADDGRVVDFRRWSAENKTASVTPIISGNTFFISAAYGKGCSLMALKNGRLERVYHRKGKLAMSNHFNNSVLWKGKLYGFSGHSNSSRNAQFVCMDHATGEILWQQRGAKTGLGCGSLMIADGQLIVMGDQGELAVFPATETMPDFDTVSRVKVLQGKCWTMPVLAGGRIFCRNAKGDLACVNLSDLSLVRRPSEASIR